MRFGMLAAIGWWSKPFWALATFKWLSPSVCVDVVRQVPVARESLVTKMALEWLLTSVHTDVNWQIGIGCETLVADVTLKVPLPFANFIGIIGVFRWVGWIALFFWRWQMVDSNAIRRRRRLRTVGHFTRLIFAWTWRRTNDLASFHFVDVFLLVVVCCQSPSSRIGDPTCRRRDVGGRQRKAIALFLSRRQTRSRATYSSSNRLIRFVVALDGSWEESTLGSSLTNWIRKRSRFYRRWMASCVIKNRNYNRRGWEYKNDAINQ